MPYCRPVKMWGLGIHRSCYFGCTSYEMDVFSFQQCLSKTFPYSHSFFFSFFPFFQLDFKLCFELLNQKANATSSMEHSPTTACRSTNLHNPPCFDSFNEEKASESSSFNYIFLPKIHGILTILQLSSLLF